MTKLIPEPYFSFSKELRKNQTPWETKLWQHLRAGRFCELKFKRQVQIGIYIVDFSCREKRIVVELDGGQHNTDNGKIEDQKKQKFLESQGYVVLHFWNNEVDNNINGVLEEIRERLLGRGNLSTLRASLLRRRELRGI